MYEWKTRSKNSSYLSIGFDEDNGRRKQKLCTNKEAPNKAKFHGSFIKKLFNMLSVKEMGFGV